MIIFLVYLVALFYFSYESTYFTYFSITSLPILYILGFSSIKSIYNDAKIIIAFTLILTLLTFYKFSYDGIQLITISASIIGISLIIIIFKKIINKIF